VRQHRPIGLAGDVLELLLPAGRLGVGELDLAHDPVVDQFAELVLARDVPVEGGRARAELLPEAPDRERVDAVGVEDRQRGVDDRIA
jgi:hypothetical protein